MKKLILILGILIGLTIGVSSQNDTESITEEEVTDLVEYLEEYLNSSPIEPQILPNQPVTLNGMAVDKLYPKAPFNEKIKNLFLSLNNSSSPNDIANLIDSLYVRSVDRFQMCLDLCDDGQFCDGNIRLVYDQLKEAILNDLYYKEIRVSVKCEIIQGSSTLSVPTDLDYQLVFNIYIDGEAEEFSMYIFNEKIAQITWCGEFIEY